MACGTPVLASDIPAFRETIGEAGHLVDPYSIEEIADGLYRLLMDRELRKKMVHRGIEKAELFRWEKTAQLTLECYQDVFQSHY
jgi:glycosyltransferase involved in cell wall biosynthesis